MLKSFLNKKHALTILTDAEFEALLPQLAAELAAHGVLRETYADVDIQKDWALLLRKNARNSKTKMAREATTAQLCTNQMNEKA